MKKIYVVTGGPCVGKTTILNDLEKKGFHVIHEIARKVIEEQQATGGDILPWIRIEKFNQVVFETHKKIENGLSNGIHFIDRGTGDIIGYLNHFGGNIPDGVKEYSKPPRYYKIIILDQLGFFENDDVRKEDPEAAKKIHEAVERAYIDLGYDIIRVPPLPKPERLEWLIKKLGLNNYNKKD